MNWEGNYMIDWQLVNGGRIVPYLLGVECILFPTREVGAEVRY